MSDNLESGNTGHNKKYYKFVWEYLYEHCTDEGEYGVFFASSNNQIFRLAEKCKRYLETYQSKKSYEEYVIIEACANILDNRVELSRKEYHACKKHGSLIGVGAGSCDGGLYMEIKVPSRGQLIKRVKDALYTIKQL
jgi:hypothetical protein